RLAVGLHADGGFALAGRTDVTLGADADNAGRFGRIPGRVSAVALPAVRSLGGDQELPARLHAFPLEAPPGYRHGGRGRFVGRVQARRQHQEDSHTDRGNGASLRLVHAFSIGPGWRRGSAWLPAPGE